MRVAWFATNRSKKDTAVITRFQPAKVQQLVAPTYTRLIQEIADLQRQNPDHVMLVQVGSFYEIYDLGGYLDEVSRMLGLRIAVQKLRKDPVRFAGFPMVSLRDYLTALLQNGKTVALVHQVGRDYLGGNKTLKRAVTRIVTPGTILEDDGAMNGAENSFLLSIAGPTARLGLAWMDVSTGEFFMAQTPFSSLSSELSRILPKEILMPLSLKDSVVAKLVQETTDKSILVTFKEDELFTATDSIDRFNAVLRQSSQHPSAIISKANPSSEYSEAQISAASGLLSYLKHNFPEAEPAFRPPVSLDEPCMRIDSTTLSALEIMRSSRERSVKGSLFGAMNLTKTSGGSRLLSMRLKSPSIDISEINRRLNLVDAFYVDTLFCANLTHLLDSCGDITRSLQRLLLGKKNIVDFKTILETLAQVEQIRETLQSQYLKHVSRSVLKKSLTPVGKALQDLCLKLGDLSELRQRFSGFLHDEAFDGGTDTVIVAKGVSKDIDELRLEKSQLEQKREALKQELEMKYGLKLLFIVDSRRGPVLEFPKVSKTMRMNLDAVIAREKETEVIPVQRSTTTVRHKHEKWTLLYHEMQDIEDRLAKLESSVFSDACEEVASCSTQLVQTADALAEIDLSCSLAKLAHEKNLVRPNITQELKHSIKGGRHPVVEEFQTSRGRMFIKNDVNLYGDEKLWMLTGPNMGGKSTFLRQCALFSIMAQSGSYVPAEAAELGIVDAVFSRIGASDDLSANQSTFMVEMKETAYILENATPQSLVIMDEVGRGTSMLDGLSLAYAIMHHLVSETKCRGLFATHYHELASLLRKDGLKGVGCYQAAVHQDENGELTCLYQIIPGVMSESHGIEIASYAGIPKPVIATARSMYRTLDAQSKPFT